MYNIEELAGGIVTDSLLDYYCVIQIHFAVWAIKPKLDLYLDPTYFYPRHLQDILLVHFKDPSFWCARNEV